jgi:hypothetical protein
MGVLQPTMGSTLALGPSSISSFRSNAGETQLTIPQEDRPPSDEGAAQRKTEAGESCKLAIA